MYQHVLCSTDILTFHVGFDGFATHGASHILPVVVVLGTIPFAYTPIVKLVSPLCRGDERLHVPRTNGAIGIIHIIRLFWYSVATIRHSQKINHRRSSIVDCCSRTSAARLLETARRSAPNDSQHLGRVCRPCRATSAFVDSDSKSRP